MDSGAPGPSETARTGLNSLCRDIAEHSLWALTHPGPAPQAEVSCLLPLFLPVSMDTTQEILNTSAVGFPSVFVLLLEFHGGFYLALSFQKARHSPVHLLQSDTSSLQSLERGHWSDQDTWLPLEAASWMWALNLVRNEAINRVPCKISRQVKWGRKQLIF